MMTKEEFLRSLEEELERDIQRGEADWVDSIDSQIPKIIDEEEDYD